MGEHTHQRARDWAAEKLNAADAGYGAGYHLRDAGGRRIRGAGRHVREREPNYFAVGSTLVGEPFDDVVVVLFDTDWTLRYAYRLPLEAVVDHHTQPRQQGCRLTIRGDVAWREDVRAERLA